MVTRFANNHITNQPLAPDDGVEDTEEEEQPSAGGFVDVSCERAAIANN